MPLKDQLGTDIQGEALLKMEDNITTDHIIPATQDILMYRSNVPKLSEFTLSRVDETFADRALEADGGFLVAGENYGQGSSREHAALCPMYLGIEGVLAQSFARIHRANLFNFGIVPLTIDEDTYENIDQATTSRSSTTSTMPSPAVRRSSPSVSTARTSTRRRSTPPSASAQSSLPVASCPGRKSRPKAAAARRPPTTEDPATLSILSFFSSPRSGDAPSRARASGLPSARPNAAVPATAAGQRHRHTVPADSIVECLPVDTKTLAIDACSIATV